MFHRLTLAAGSVLAAAVAGAYVLWGPSISSSTKKKSKDKCLGLQNIGNSCFLNSLLQAWAACPSIYTWLHSSISSSRSDNMIAGTILKILKVLNNEEEGAPDPYNPSHVFQDLRARRWVITADEQDAHELFHVLTETLDEETSRYPRVLSLFDVKNLQDPSNKYQPSQTAHTRSNGLLPKLPPKEVDQPTRGLLASQLQCLQCGFRSPVKYDVFDSISLTVPRNYWGPMSLDMLLHQFISPEIVQDVDCQGCSRITGLKKAKSNFRKKISIGKLPQVLCIHLQRTQWLDNGAAVKRMDHIGFPETLYMEQYLFANQKKCGGDVSGGLLGGADLTFQMLSQSPKPTTVTNSGPVNLLRTLNYDQHLTQTGLFVHNTHFSPQLPSTSHDINHNAPPELFKSPQSDFSYRLAAAINHLGDIQSGHFVAYRRGAHNGVRGPAGGLGLGSRWWLTSDAQVRRVSLDQVLSSEAYMLFYERL